MHPTTTELQLIDVAGRGVPNKECIVLRALTKLSTGEYGLMLGIAADSSEQADAHPVPDNMLWFGHGEMSQGDWLFVFTCQGTPSVDEMPNGERIFSLYWGRKTTVFYDPKIVPILIRFAEVAVLPPPPAPMPLPQAPVIAPPALPS